MVGESQIQRVMEETGMDYLRARNHLLGRQQALREIERRRRQAVADTLKQLYQEKESQRDHLPQQGRH